MNFGLQTTYQTYFHIFSILLVELIGLTNNKLTNAGQNGSFLFSFSPSFEVNKSTKKSETLQTNYLNIVSPHQLILAQNRWINGLRWFKRKQKTTRSFVRYSLMKRFFTGMRRIFTWKLPWSQMLGDVSVHTYCWWTNSCTTKDDDYPIIYRVLTIPGGAGFRPSTVSSSISINTFHLLYIHIHWCWNLEGVYHIYVCIALVSLVWQ